MSSRVVRWVTPLHRWSGRYIKHVCVKDLNLARTTCSNSWSVCSHPFALLAARFSSTLSSNEGSYNSKETTGSTSQDGRSEGTVASGVKTPGDSPLMTQSFTQQSKDAVAAEPENTRISPIPPLPPFVVGYPTPWIGKEDHQQYLAPLYSRGWGISFKIPRRTMKDAFIDGEISTSLDKPRPTAHLVVRYKFPNYKIAAAFLAKVAEIADSENHHPHILTIEHGKKPSVALVIQTDSARRPTWNQPQTRNRPGITRRDLRLAILVETLYSDEYEGGEDMRSVRPADHKPNWDRLIRRLQGSSLSQLALTELNRQQPFDVKCHACGGPHTLGKCPDRHTIPPRKPCGHCGENHWMRDCPKVLRGMYQCRICGMNHPTEVCPQGKPIVQCPHCGGDHWLSDCREPQIGEKAIQEMVLPLPPTPPFPDEK